MGVGLLIGAALAHMRRFRELEGREASKEFDGCPVIGNSTKESHSGD
jgi:hypothetical protein